MSLITTRTLFIEAAKIAAKRVKIIHPRPLLMRLDFEDSIHIFTHGSKPNFNATVSGKIAKDKDLTVRVLNELSLPTPRSHFVTLTREKFSRVNDMTHAQEYKDLLAFAHSVNFPIFLKPNQGSQGHNVFCIRDEMGLNSIMQSVLRRAPGYFIAQEAAVGEEYRIVVVQGHIELAYFRKPLSVVGDGVSTIQNLVAQRNAYLQKRGRFTNLKSNSEKIVTHLQGKGLSLDSVPRQGEVVTVLANRNLSDGSEPVECTDMIRARYAQICRDVYEKAGVDYCGLDLIEDTRSGGIQPVIIEINSNPGYKHFIRSAPENAELVRGVFVETIRASHRKQAMLRAALRPQARAVIANQNQLHHPQEALVLQ